MALLTNIKHYNDIIWLLYKYGHNDILKDFGSKLDLPQILKERGTEKGKAENLVKDLESLGPFYIKLGQILSSEVQLLPQEYNEALQKLQDQATPMPYEEVESIIISELGDSPHNIFKLFESTPLSAASLGQVHFAKLQSGKKVAVKIQRKDIQQTILEQLDALGQICSLLEENTEWGKKYQILDKFRNLKFILLNELDYLKEAENLKTLFINLEEFKNLVIPLPVDQFTTSRVLTMEFIDSEKITELNPIRKIDIKGKELANELFRAFLKQILLDGFFQMDPHPGNIYLAYINGNPTLAILDLGMVAHIPFQMQGQLIRCLLALSENKELEMTKILISLGKKTVNFDEYALRTSISEIMGNYREKTVTQIPMGKIVLKLSYVAAESGLWLPIEFTMIGKTLLSLSPVLKALDPNFSPEQLLRSQASELINKRLAQQLSYQSLFGSVLEGIEFLEHLPGRLNEIFDLLSNNDRQLNIRFLESENLANNFEKIANRIAIGLILSALVISSALLMQIQTPYKLFGYPAFAMILFLLAATGALLLMLTIIWKDQKKNKKF